MIPVLFFIIWITPFKYRLFMGISLLISLELWNSLAAGETGFLLFPFLLLGWILPKKNIWVSALCIGLAATVKQVHGSLYPSI
jgi:hypothetical protein